MATAPQIAAASAGTAGAVAAGSYGISQLLSSEEENTNEEPKCITFDPNTSLESPYSTSLLSITKNSNLSFIAKPIKDNKDWWDWAFKNKYQTKKDTEKHSLFEELTLGFDETETNTKSLNQACNSAYKLAITEYKISEGFLLKNISDFCTKGDSFDISEPKVLNFGESDGTEAEYKFGILSVAENKGKLVKKENTNNNKLWWEWAFKNLFENYKDKQNSHFQHVNKGYGDNAVQSGQNETSLNHACDSAYKKDKLDLEATNSKLLKEIGMFCSSVKPTPNLNSPIEPTFTLISNSSQKASYNTGLANENGNKEKLLDPEDEKNQGWFKWVFDNQISKITEKTQNLPSIFQSVDKGWEASAGQTTGSQTGLNQACKEGYSKAKNELETKTKNKDLVVFIKDFCSPKSIKDKLAVPKS